MHTSVAPRSHASRARRTISSSREEVALFLAVVAAERAEGAVLDADVGEVDVAVDDVGDIVADLPGAQLVGGGGDRRATSLAGARAQHLGVVCGRARRPRARRSRTLGSVRVVDHHCLHRSSSGFTRPSGRRALRRAVAFFPEKARLVDDVLGVDAEPLAKLVAHGLGRLAQSARSMRPRGLGVDVVDGQRRDASPVVETRANEARDRSRGTGWAAPGG